MAKRSAILISAAAFSVLALFSSTAVASGPGLIKDPTKLDFGTERFATQGFAPRDITIINNTGGFTSTRGQYTLTGDTDATGDGPFAVNVDGSDCDAPNTASDPISGVTGILGTREEGNPLFPPECVFQ